MKEAMDARDVSKEEKQIGIKLFVEMLIIIKKKTVNRDENINENSIKRFLNMRRKMYSTK